MKVLLPFLLGITYIAEEIPGHFHSKTGKEGSKEGSKEGKLKTEDANVAATGDSAGIK